jgi:hypothetical protein
MSERFTIPETISRQINTENNRRKINGSRVHSMYLPTTVLKLIGSIAPNWACAGVIYSQLFKYKQQHTAGFTENNWIRHLFRTALYIPVYTFSYTTLHSQYISTSCSQCKCSQDQQSSFVVITRKESKDIGLVLWSLTPLSKIFQFISLRSISSVK